MTPPKGARVQRRRPDDMLTYRVVRIKHEDGELFIALRPWHEPYARVQWVHADEVEVLPWQGAE